jgi:PAS domain S-box-containing protein
MNESARDAETDALLAKLKRENAELREERENLQRLVTEHNELLHLTSFVLNRVHEAAYLLDKAGRLVYVNEEACRTLGYSNAELLQMSVADIDPEWTIPLWKQEWSVLRERGSRIIETTHRRRDGARFRSRSTPTTSNMAEKNTTWRSHAMSRSASTQSTHCGKASSVTGRSSTMSRTCFICSRSRRKDAFAYSK